MNIINIFYKGLKCSRLTIWIIFLPLFFILGSQKILASHSKDSLDGTYVLYGFAAGFQDNSSG